MHGARAAAGRDELLAGDALTLVEADPAWLSLLSDMECRQVKVRHGHAICSDAGQI